MQVQVDALEITNIALHAGYDDAEKDRLYWVNKYKEAEHRAEVWEQATRDMIYTDGCFGCHARFHGVCPDENLKEEKCLQYIYKQAEKELSEDRKDE